MDRYGAICFLQFQIRLCTIWCRLPGNLNRFGQIDYFTQCANFQIWFNIFCLLTSSKTPLGQFTQRRGTHAETRLYPNLKHLSRYPLGVGHGLTIVCVSLKRLLADDIFARLQRADCLGDKRRLHQFQTLRSFNDIQ